jgi:hypothetical protein
MNHSMYEFLGSGNVLRQYLHSFIVVFKTKIDIYIDINGASVVFNKIVGITLFASVYPLSTNVTFCLHLFLCCLCMGNYGCLVLFFSDSRTYC